MKTQDFPSALYVIATPIGNLGDLSARASEILRTVNWVAAEDTRETRKLLEYVGSKAELLSFHEHSKPLEAQKLVERITRGERGAYVSDAGTPGVSDPGAVLVNTAFAAGVRVVPVPGASALTAILSASGYSGEAPLSFAGFLPREKLREYFLALHPGLHVFFESPHRVDESLKILAEVFPDAPLVLGRELTKKFEEVKKGKVAEIFAALGEPRGEYVLALELAAREEVGPDCKKLFQELAELGANQKILVRVGEEKGLKRNEAYKLALEVLKGI